MMLSGREIKKRLGSDIIIDPFDEKQLNPNSYDLRLNDSLLVYVQGPVPLDVKKDNPTKSCIFPETGAQLNPGNIYLGSTVEWTATRNLVPMINGKSSLGRLGISIHITAGFGDIGFCGHWTLELFVIEPVIIYPWIPICQICYFEVTPDFEEYRGKYQNSKKVLSSRSYLDFLDKKD